MALCLYRGSVPVAVNFDPVTGGSITVAGISLHLVGCSVPVADGSVPGAIYMFLKLVSMFL